MIKEVENYMPDDDPTKDWEVKKGGLLNVEEEEKQPEEKTTPMADVVKDDIKDTPPAEQEPLTVEGEQKQIDSELEQEENTEPIQANPVETPEQEPFQDPLDDPSVLNDYDAYIKSLGWDDEKMNEKVYTTEQEQAALKRQQNWSAIGEVAKIIMEGAGASGGMYVEKRSPNPYMERTYKRLQELKDKDLLDSRRREQNRVNNELRKVGMFQRHKTAQDAIQSRTSNTNARIAADIIGREDQQAHDKEMQKMKYENDIDSNPEKKLAYEEELLKLKTKYEQSKRSATTASEMAKIDAKLQADKELLDYKFSSGYSSGSLKIGDKVFSKEAIEDEAMNIIKSLPSKYGEKGYSDLPQWLKKIISGDKLPSTREMESIVKMYYKPESDDESAIGQNVPYQEGTERVDEEAETQGGYWNDEEPVVETDIYGIPKTK